jgi:hypothetical protein
VDALLEGLTQEEFSSLMDGVLGLQRELFIGSGPHLRLAAVPVD